MTGAKAGRLAGKSGINPVPIIIFVVVAALIGAGLFTWDYFWRRGQEAARRPPPADVIVRNLVENIIGPGTVKEVKLDTAAGTVTVTFEDPTFKPDEAQKDPQKFAQAAREYLDAEAKLASGAILEVPESLASQVPAFLELKKVLLTIVYKDATLATATAERGKEIQITYVDPRVK